MALPSHLKIFDLEPICWVQVPWNLKQQVRCKFIDGSKGKLDPDFRHLVIAPDRIPGYEEYFLICYFDDKGTWITQSPYDTMNEAFDQGAHAFDVRKDDWHWVSRFELMDE